MIINPGMLIFCILDSLVAFFLVFFVTRSKFGGPQKTLARAIASFLATVVGILYLGATIWFNTEQHTISETAKNVVYALPIVLSVLMIILTLLSQPQKNEDEEEENGENTEEGEENEEADNESQDAV